jgi:hypothetical protein
MTSLAGDPWVSVDCDTELLPDGTTGISGFKRLLAYAVQAGAVPDLTGWLWVRTPGHPENGHGPGWQFWFPAPAGGVQLGPLKRCKWIEIKAFCTAPGSPGYVVRNDPGERPVFPGWLLDLAGRSAGKEKRVSVGASGITEKIPDWDWLAREEMNMIPEPEPDETGDDDLRYRRAVNAGAFQERVHRASKRIVDDEEYTAARGEWVRRTAAEYAALPKCPAIITDVLAAEGNLLGGPSEAGKSLVARDWLIHVAAGEDWRGYAVPERRTAVFAASEGLSDFSDRWETHPLWPAARDRVLIQDVPVNLTSADDVDRFLRFYDADRPGLACFDVIYGMGMTDDTGSKDVGPVIAAMKRISAAWGCATLAVGHPGHNAERRFRGSSMWRQLCYTEWHLADDLFTCEKNKLARKEKFTAGYQVEYPSIKWLTPGEMLGTLARDMERTTIIMNDLKECPADSDNARAARLMGDLGVGHDRARKLIAECRRRTGR